jgi:hypothetical protein
MTQLRFLDVVQQSERKLKEHVVDCGTCPVSMACAISQGGTGWRFQCCGSTSVSIPGNTLYIMDCGNNQFEVNKDEFHRKVCPLCTGDIIESAVRGNTECYRYVPTVHAKVPLKTRLDVWRDRLPKAQQRVQEEKLRLKED